MSDIDKLKGAAAPYNPRKISEEQLKLLAKAMVEFGDLGGIVLNRRTGRLVGGHQRIKVIPEGATVEAQPASDPSGTVAVGFVEFPGGIRFAYREVDWAEDKEMAANIAANRHGGEWDYPKLKDLLLEVDTSPLELDLTGFTDPQMRDMLDLPQPTDISGKGEGEIICSCPECGHDHPRKKDEGSD